MAFPVKPQTARLELGEALFNQLAPLNIDYIGNVATEFEAQALAYSLNLTATSVTSLALSVLGSKTITVQTGLGFIKNMPLRVGSTVSPGNFADGIITDYVTGTGALTFNATAFGGSGTFTAWNVFLLPSASNVASLSTNNFLGVQNFAQGADIASAATINLTTATGNTLNVTGVVATSVVTLGAGMTRRVRATGAWPLTYNATTNNITGGISTTLAAGDEVEYKNISGVVYGTIIKTSGRALTESTNVDFRQTVISGAVGGDTYTGTSITLATPGVITVSATHGKENDTPFYFTTGGIFPTGYAANTQYFARVVSGATLQGALTAGGASITTTVSAGSGLTLVWGVLNNAFGTPLLGGALGATTVTTSNINATTPLRVSFANGYNASGQVNLIGTSTANLTFSNLLTNGTMYGYLTWSAGANVTSVGTLAPVIQQQGIPSIVSGQYTYNLKEAKMYLGNGATASQVNTVQVATFTVAAGVVSAITWLPFRVAAVEDSAIVSGTAVTTTSGTSVDFTGIPSWVKKITVMLSGVSTNLTSVLLMQLGDSGGVETTGYTSMGSGITSASAASVPQTAGFGLVSSVRATDVYGGSFILNLLDPATNTWTILGSMSTNTNAFMGIASGSKALSSTLDRVRLTTVNGTDTFDAGTVNISYE